MCHHDAWRIDALQEEGPMFGDAMFDEEERLRRAAEGQADGLPEADDGQELIAAGGLNEHLRRRQAIAQLLREVGGC